MDVEFFLRADDILAFHQYYLERRPRPRRVRWLFLLSGVLIIALLWLNYTRPGATDLTVPLIFTAVILVVTLFTTFHRGAVPALVLRQLRTKLDEEWSRKLLGSRRLSLTPESMTYTGKLTTATARWEAVEQITVTEEHAFFFITRTTGFVLPVRAFADEEAFREFVKAARRYRKAARAEETGFTAEEPADD